MKQTRNEAVEEYAMRAHSAILYNLVDVMAELNPAELDEKANLNEWLSHWKMKALDEIWRAMQEAKE